MDSPDESYDYEYQMWRAEVEEKYVAYKEKACRCEVNDECDCMTINQYEKSLLELLHNYWDWREEEYQEKENV